MMMQGELRQNALALRGKRQQYLAAVVLGPLAAYIPSPFQAVDQLDRAVVLNLHAVGQFPNARTYSLGYAFDGQHKLILPALQTGCVYGGFTEMQVPANLIPEFRQSLIVRQGQPLHTENCIVPR